MNHFLDLDKIDKKDLEKILATAAALKKASDKNQLAGKQLAMIFEKPSTRTRTSFEVGINQLGGGAIVLSSADTQLGHGETIADTAKVLSRFVDIIMIRTFEHEKLTELAENSSVPVINGLTDFSHPCQIMADLLTFSEHKGEIKGKTIAWVGDYNNVARSWLRASDIFGFTLNIACPEALHPEGDNVFSDATEAVKNADLVITDTWASMGDEDGDYKKRLLKPFQVNDELMGLAKSDAIFMHCLPAHRGEEVTNSVIDGKQSVVFDEAENRLHVQKAIMLWCMGKI